MSNFAFHAALIAGALAMPVTALPCTIQTASPAIGSYDSWTDVAYETVGGAAIKLDLYVPKTASAPPVILFIHGGSFVAGDKSAHTGDARLLMENTNIAVANINYRLSVPKTPMTSAVNPFPAAVQDVRCAVRWLRANAYRYGINATKIGALGLSAGANLAAETAVVPVNDNYFDSPSCGLGQYSPSLDAVVSLYGLYDFVTVPTLVLPYLKGISGNSSLGASASPQLWLSPAAPPFFLARGTADTVLPAAQQDGMVSALRAAGLAERAEEVVGLPHGFGPLAVQRYPALQQTACDMLSFIAGNL